MMPTIRKHNLFSPARLPALVALTAFFLLLDTAATAQTLSVLYNFTGGADGAYPAAPLLLDAESNVYGTTPFGGKIRPQCGPAGCGVLFAVSPSGTETVLHSFFFSDGAAPNGLLRDAAGSFYLTTQVGGANGSGTVLETTSEGTEKVLYGFIANNASQPRAGLVRDTKGNFYGPTEQGGYFGGSCGGGCGTIFKVTPTGTATVLYRFLGAPDPAYPTTGLTVDAHGNLYGTTTAGGAYGFGTVYRVTPTGVETVLYSFTNQADGGYPTGTLFLDTQGNFYGTTAAGGYFGGSCTNGCGTVFTITPDGRERVLYSFRGVPDGSAPSGGLIQDSEGNLYGTTELGGNPFNFSGSGTIFKLTPAGKETVLYTFSGGADGAYPLAGLVMDQQENLYGTTEEGGASGFGSFGYGTVFKLVP
jgi:uncharacterized repeat protein (TIGR03803 family)